MPGHTQPGFHYRNRIAVSGAKQRPVNARNAPVVGSEMLYGCGRMKRPFAAVMVYIM